MKYCLLGILLVGSSFIGQVYAQLNWEIAGTPGNLISLTSDGSTLYLCSNLQLRSSSDNGHEWKTLKSWIDDAHLRTVAVRGSTIFVGSSVGVWRSTNNGESWSMANSGLPDKTDVSEFGINSSTVFAATTRGIYRSTDNGSTWSILSLDTISHSSVDVNGTSVFTYAGKGVSVLSTDNGNTWTPLSNNGMPYIVGVSRFLTECLHGDEVFRGCDSGVMHYDKTLQSWKFVGLLDRRIVQLYSAGTSLFACEDGAGLTMPKKIYRTSNNGTTWETLGFLHEDIRSIVEQNGAFYAALNSDSLRARSGVFRYAGGATWSELPMNLYSFSNNDLAYCEGKLFATTRQGLQVSTDNGTTWIFPKTPFDFKYVRGLASLEKTILVAADSLYRSSDAGLTWKAVYKYGTQYGAGAIHINGEEIYTSTGPVRSIDDGLTWQEMSPLSLVTSFAHDSLSLYAGRDCAGVYRLSKDANTWEKCNYDMGMRCIQSVAAIGDVILAGTAYRQTDRPRGIFRSTDHGENWTLCTSGLPPDAPGMSYTVTVLQAHDGSLYAAITSYGVFRSIDTGLTWEYIGLNGAYITSLAFTNDFIFAGGSGVYRASLRSIDDPAPHNEGGQLFPNPAIDEFTVYHVGEKELRIEMLDLLGRIVLTKHADSETGEHQILIDVRTLAPGVYFVRFGTNDPIVQKVLIL